MVTSRILLVVVIVANSQLLCESAKLPNQQNLLESLSGMLDVALSGFKYCPPPYYHVLGECFYVHQYIPQLTWQEAQDFCKQSGGIGAEPKFFGAVIAQLFNMGKAKEIYNRELARVWLGGRRVDNTTNFEWSSGRPIDGTVEDEQLAPNYYSDIVDGDCVMMVLSQQGPSTLQAKDCEARVHYACQLL